MAQRGDQAAEAEIVERYRPLAGYAATDARVPGLESGDIMSLALLAILKAVRSYKDERLAFARYARLVISREIVSAARKSVRVPKRGDYTYADEIAEIDEYVVDVRATTDDDGAASANLESILSALTERERVILLKRIEGDSESAIARELGVSRLKVREHMKRIREVAEPILEAHESTVYFGDES